MSEAFYEMQRKLVKNRINAVKKGNIGLIDIGSSKVVCFILHFVPEDEHGKSKLDAEKSQRTNAFRIIGAATTRSRGVTAGAIKNMDEVEKAIRTVVQAAQKMAAILLEDVLVSFSGGNPRSYGVSGSTKVSNKKVSVIDIGQALVNSDIPNYGTNREVIHALPVNFSLDDRTGLIDPRGQLGTDLVVDLHLMTVDKDVLYNIINAVSKCRLTLCGISFAPYVAGVSSLTEDEHQLGAACIDLGAGTSGVTIFLRKQMIYGGTVNLGGIQVTSDIMKAFNISFEAAERIKNLHGGLISISRDDRDMIEIERPLHYSDDDRILISRADLIAVIRPRIEEILEELRDQLDVAGFRHLNAKKIILTGGGSQLPGLFDIGSKILGSPVRIGKPMRIQGLPHATNGPEFAASVGLALHAGYPQDECWDFHVPFGRARFANVNGVFKWFAENW